LTLTKWGALVDIADNGLIALDLTRQNNYNIILMDLQMPEMDGEEATQQIRLMEKPKNEIPIIAMTASALRGEREKCLEIGMNDYISKPFNQSELHAKITSLLPSGIPKINTPSSLAFQF
jgi:CheY-like chemotaxis protein